MNSQVVVAEFEVRTDAEGFSFVTPAEGNELPYWLVDELESFYVYGEDLPKPDPGDVAGPYSVEWDPKEEVIHSDPEEVGGD